MMEVSICVIDGPPLSRVVSVSTLKCKFISSQRSKDTRTFEPYIACIPDKLINSIKMGFEHVVAQCRRRLEFAIETATKTVANAWKLRTGFYM